MRDNSRLLDSHCISCGARPGKECTKHCNLPKTTPPKPSERDLASEFAGLEIYKYFPNSVELDEAEDANCSSLYHGLRTGYKAGAASERKRCEDMLEIAVGAMSKAERLIRLVRYEDIGGVHSPAVKILEEALETLLNENARISALKEKP